MAPSDLVLRAGLWAYSGTPSHSKISCGASTFFGKEVFPSASPLMCSWKIRNSYVSLDKAPLCLETRGLNVCSSCLPPLPTTESLGSFPWQTGGVELGGLPGSLQSCRAEGTPGCLGRVRGLEEGEGVERPPSFSPGSR